MCVLCLNVTGDVNVGNMIRTACLYGCRTFFLAGRKRWDRRGSVGANHYIDVVYLPCIFDVIIDTHHELCCSCGKCKKVNNEALLEFLKRYNMTPCFVEQGGINIVDKVWKKTVRRPVFIYGNENSGIPRETINYIKQYIPETVVLSIPQIGIMRSHNVTTACTIALWEYIRVQQFNINL